MLQVVVGNYVARWACLKYSGDALLWWVIVAIVCGVGGGLLLLLAIIVSVVIARRRNQRTTGRRSGRVEEDKNNVGRETVVEVGRQKNGKENKRRDKVTKKNGKNHREGGYKRGNGDGEDRYKKTVRHGGGTYSKDIDFNGQGSSRSKVRNNGEYNTEIELQEGSYSRHLERDTYPYSKRSDCNESDSNAGYLKVQEEGSSRYVRRLPGDNDHDSEANFDAPDYSDHSGSDKDGTSVTKDSSYFANFGARDTFYTRRVSSILQTESDEPDKRSNDANYLQARSSIREYSGKIPPDRFEKQSDLFGSVSDTYPIFEQDKHRPILRPKTNSPTKVGTEKGLPYGQLISMPYGRQQLTGNIRGNVRGMPRNSNFGGFYGLHAISVPRNGNESLDSETKPEDVFHTNEKNPLQKPRNKLALAFQRIFPGHRKNKKNNDTQ